MNYSKRFNRMLSDISDLPSGLYFWRGRRSRKRGFDLPLHGRMVRHDLCGLAVGFIAGAALMWFLDPDRGARRRNVARDRTISTFRRTGTQVGRFGHKIGSDAYGWGQKVVHPGLTQDQPANDAVLARKVESELFRSRDVPKGRININAEEGIVVLRGELDRPEEIRELVEAAGRVPGVRAVENLLHLPNTPAPNKQLARSSD